MGANKYSLNVDIDDGDVSIGLPERDAYTQQQMANVLDPLIAQLVIFGKTFWKLETILKAVEEGWRNGNMLISDEVLAEETDYVN